MNLLPLFAAFRFEVPNRKCCKRCRTSNRRHWPRGVPLLAGQRSRIMSAKKAEDAIAAPGRPFTGAEYLASLRDGREVYIYGERVEDVTTHPAFRNAARSVARIYD